jgi:TPR repeat protein
MKRAVILSLVAFLFGVTSHAQYSARKLTRRIAPQLPPPPAQPGRPAPAVPNAPAANPGVPAARPIVTGPTVPQKTPEQKEEADKKLLEYQKGRAEKGSDNAQYELGMRYLTGKGVEKDEKQAREWLQKAADGGNSMAKKKLAELQPAEEKQK